MSSCDIGWAVDRDHQVVDRRRDRVGVLREQQSGRDQRHLDPAFAQPVAERPEVAVQQRLAAGQHDALHVQRANRSR